MALRKGASKTNRSNNVESKLWNLFRVRSAPHSDYVTFTGHLKSNKRREKRKKKKLKSEWKALVVLPSLYILNWDGEIAHWPTLSDYDDELFQDLRAHDLRNHLVGVCFFSFFQQQARQAKAFTICIIKRDKPGDDGRGKKRKKKNKKNSRHWKWNQLGGFFNSLHTDARGLMLKLFGIM